MTPGYRRRRRRRRGAARLGFGPRAGSRNGRDRLSNGIVRLSDLAVGERARIVSIEGLGPSRRRLLDLGFVRGQDVAVARVAPLGDPMELLIKGYHLSVRRHEVVGITVELMDA